MSRQDMFLVTFGVVVVFNVCLLLCNVSLSSNFVEDITGTDLRSAVFSVFVCVLFLEHVASMSVLVCKSLLWTWAQVPACGRTMVLCEDSECSVCFSAYSRMDRIPRVLHCRHTFCETCLQTMSRPSGELLRVGCPLCCRVTCIPRGLSLQEALWVDGHLWDQIPEDERTAPDGQMCQAQW